MRRFQHREVWVGGCISAWNRLSTEPSGLWILSVGWDFWNEIIWLEIPNPAFPSQRELRDTKQRWNVFFDGLFSRLTPAYCESWRDSLILTAKMVSDKLLHCLRIWGAYKKQTNKKLPDEQSTTSRNYWALVIALESVACVQGRTVLEWQLIDSVHRKASLQHPGCPARGPQCETVPWNDGIVLCLFVVSLIS